MKSNLIWRRLPHRSGIAAQSAVIAAEPAEAPEAHAAGCTLATLRGTLSWNATYTKSGVARAGSGFEWYDGPGLWHLKYTELVSDGATTSTYSGTGTYTITAGCIASRHLQRLRSRVRVLRRTGRQLVRVDQQPESGCRRVRARRTRSRELLVR